MKSTSTTHSSSVARIVRAGKSMTARESRPTRGEPARESRPTGERAFTLIEMLVAVGVVAILTIGIGQIFGSVSKLVGTGSAVAEVDQAARTVEAQMRDDFEALSAMRADETFIAIRNTRLGDFDLNSSTPFSTSRDVDLYLTRADEQADLRDQYVPYEVGLNGEKRSRAVTVRLDEITFIGQSGTGYQSFQDGVQGLASNAMISYGHALRPPRETDEDAKNRGEKKPRRLNYADGYFGDPAGKTNRFSPYTTNDVTGRNRYASDFVLSRQALLLYGSEAFGYQRAHGTSGDIFYPAPLGYDTEIAMYIRDLEASDYFFGGAPQSDDLTRNPFGLLGAWPPTYGPVMGGYPYWAVSKPAPLRHGRTDICMMDRDSAQRWLEGGVPAPTSQPSKEGVPFDSGILYEFQSTRPSPPYPAVNLPLWYRAYLPFPAGAPGPPPVNLKTAYLTNLRGLQSAIAGTLCRKLVETEPPDLRVNADDYNNPAPDPRDRRMDVHTILAEHCSSFEVAWSDGSRWDGGASGQQVLQWDRNGDGVYEREIQPGAVIWFDMDFTYADFWSLLPGLPKAKEARYPRPNPDPEMGLDSSHIFDTLPPENWKLPNSPLDIGGSRTVEYGNNAALNIVEDQDFWSGAYSRTYTQARDQTHADQEYLAIWGFNPPVGYDRDLTVPVPATANQDGSYAGKYARDVPWAKPKLIRIRMTLHDSQNRLPGGKLFEFIFKVDLK